QATTQALVTAYRASNGTSVWSAPLAPPNLGVDGHGGPHLAITADGRRLFESVLTGVQNLGGSFTTTALTAESGTQQWVARYQRTTPVGFVDDTPVGVFVSPNGGRV